MQKTLIYTVTILAATIMVACSGTRQLPKPQLDMPETFAGVMQADSLSYADLSWWEFYTDENLRNLIERTLEANRDLLKAAARMDELRELYGVERLNLAPKLNGIAGFTNETNNYDGHGVDKDLEISLKASVSWEINLWGAQKWARSKSRGEYLASAEDYRAMQMSLIAQTATAYFNLIALDNEIAIVRQTLVTRKESLEQARLRYEGGLTSEIVYQQAMVEYTTTASLIPALEQKRTVSVNALSLLTGDFPGKEIHRSHLFLDAEMPDSIMPGMPSRLLQRRPDLRAAELRLSAAMANVGLKYADRFPNFIVGFTGGFENDALAGFLKSPFTYSLGNISGSIFDFGRKKRNYKASISAYEQARLDYEKSVMTAFTEVDNAIAGYRNARDGAALKASLRDAALKYVQLARLQYRGGTLNYIDVLDAQRRYFDAQIGYSNARRDEYLALVQLYKAIGGGTR
ncbi:MAG: TolC family protein [Lachnoclostridium sp.]|nr:TolC family protein [Lachnoclostridium sp.]